MRGELFGLEEVFPGVVTPGVELRGAVFGVLVVGVEPPGTGTGVVTVGVVGTIAEGVAAAAVVTVLVVGGAPGPESPASFTSAAASTPSESTATAIAPSRGAFQFGDAARRVRAAAPQRRHHSCSGCSGAPHRGHVSPGARAGLPGAPVALGLSAGAAVVLTCSALPGG
jgi:hypothetical protein